MKWTAEKIAELRELAPSGIGAALIAGRMETTVYAVWARAHTLHISIARNSGTYRGGMTDDPDLDKRWAAMIGPMKAALRVEVERMMADVS